VESGPCDLLGLLKWGFARFILIPGLTNKSSPALKHHFAPIVSAHTGLTLLHVNNSGHAIIRP
jgi:hypothetical protein